MTGAGSFRRMLGSPLSGPLSRTIGGPAQNPKRRGALLGELCWQQFLGGLTVRTSELEMFKKTDHHAIPDVTVPFCECLVQELEGLPHGGEVAPRDRVFCELAEPHHFEGEIIPIVGQPRFDCRNLLAQGFNEGATV